MKIITTIIAVLAIPVASLTADEKEHKGHKAHKAHEAHAGHMLKGYLKVSKALSGDDLLAAKEAAGDMAEHDEKSSLAKAATAVSKSKDIKTAREHFLHLSQAAIALAKKKKGYVIMHCPMVKGGKGDWLQTDSVVKNPYMGKKMLSCGGPKKKK